MTEIRNLPDDWLVRKTSLNEIVEGFRDLPNSVRAEAIRAVTQFASKEVQRRLEQENWK